MAFKIVVSNPQDGKSYQVEVDGANAKRLKGKKIGDSMKGDIVGLTGYELEITGGSNKAGFPMKKGVAGLGSKKILVSGGAGYKPQKKGLKRKKTFHTQEIDDDVIQVNAKITKAGDKPVEEYLGKKEESGEEEKK